MVAKLGRWTLRKDGELLGEVIAEDVDEPWFIARWVPTEGFSDVAALFAEDLRILNSSDLEGFDELWDRILAAGIRLHSPDGHRVSEFLLHIDGDTARFRYEDKPFDMK